MRSPLHLTACLLGGLALAASGCGGSSTKTATTTSATSASTGATAQTTAQTPSHSTGATGHSTGATGPSTRSVAKQKAAEARAKAAEAAAEAKLLREKRAAEQRIAEIRAKNRSLSPAVRKARFEAGVRAARKKRKPYPPYLQQNFMTACEAGKGSTSVCMCILTKQEFSKVESGQSLAEVLALELALHEGRAVTEVRQTVAPRRPIALPAGVRLHAEECLGHG